jgi:hypothetical protein
VINNIQKANRDRVEEERKNYINLQDEQRVQLLHEKTYNGPFKLTEGAEARANRN